MNLEIHKLTIFTESELRPRYADKLRGYIGRIYRQDRLAHNHLMNGKFIYKYPLVQYKVVDNACLLIGINKGKELIIKVFNDLTYVNFDGQIVKIDSMILEKYSSTFSIFEGRKKYVFLTPWLALNGRNYKKYQRIGCHLDKRELLERILIGNILSTSKSLGYTVADTIRVVVTKFKEVNTSFKGNPMLGFLGEFEVNFEIPEYLGIGKSVSRGFGTLKKIR